MRSDGVLLLRCDDLGDARACDLGENGVVFLRGETGVLLLNIVIGVGSGVSELS